MSKFIVTSHAETMYCCLLNKKDKLMEVHPFKIEKDRIVGNVYIGQISNIVKNIQAAFIDVGLEKDVFLQLDSMNHYIYTNGKESTEVPKVGDELLVQITKDAHGSKMPTATSMIAITGRYSVLTYKKCFIGLSSKIHGMDERNRLKEIFKKSLHSMYGFIVRTNAMGVSEDHLTLEIQQLTTQFHRIMENSKYLKCFQCVYKQPAIYIQLIRDLYEHKVEEYIFDDHDIYNEAIDFFREEIYDYIIEKFRLYKDDTYTLYKLYNIGVQIDRAIQEKVWLKSGANLVIQPTEALVAIDVNTSKAISKNRNFEETVYQINMEAAKAVARQIRLRNLSGILIVDFIDMKDEKHKEHLLETLNRLLAQDRVKTVLVDMTPLGLVEITRKKTGKPLKEQLMLLNRN